MRRALDLLTYSLALLGLLFAALGPADSPARALGGGPLRAAATSGERSRLCSTVTGPDGPVRRASLRTFQEVDTRYAPAVEALTDATGSACMALANARMVLIVEAPGFARASRIITLQGDTRADFTLEAEHRLNALVLDDLGQPIDRATLLVTGTDALPFGALSDREGKVGLGRLPAPPWSVQAHALGYESARAEGVQRDLRLILRRLAAIDVHVVDGSGKAVAAANVFIAGSSLWPARRAETDASGLARLRGLSEGSYDLRASHGASVSPTLHGFELARGAEETVTLTLAPGRMITAVVTDGDAEAAPVVPGADVVLVESGVASFPLRGRSDGKGRVVLGPIASGPATLSARAPDFVGGPLVVVPERPDGPVRVPLVRGGRLRGDVVDDRGFPIEGAGIEVIGTDRYGLPIAETPLASRFRSTHFEWSLGGPLALIPAGELGVMPGPVPPIPHGPSLGVVRSLAPPDAPPLDEGSALPAPWITDAHGEFDARPVTPGRVRALVRHPDYVETASDLVSVSSGGEARVRVVLLRGGKVEGRVLDDRGFPVENAQVSLAAERGTFERRELTARDGSFAFTGAPWKVTLSVARPDDPGRPVLRRALDIPEGGQLELELTLPAARESLTVTVVDGSGTPLELAEVRVTSLAPDVPLRKTLFTGEDGQVEIEDAAGLPLRVLVDAPRFSAMERVLEPAPAELQVVLDAGVIVTGRVTAVRGRVGVADAIVTLRGQVQRRSTSSESDGAFRFESVTPGPIELRVSHPDYADATVTYQVSSTGRADRPLELEPIDLEEPGEIEGRVVDVDGNPVDGARVGVGFVPTYLPEGALPYGMTLSDGQGSFVLRGVRPGKQRLSAYAPGVGRGSVDAIEVVSGRSASGVVIRLTETSSDSEPFATGGVAVTLGERADGNGTAVVVVDVTAGSEAERGGVRAEDLLLAVDGQRPSSMADARSRLAGRAGTDVVLELSRAGSPVRLRITRQAVRR